jgi:hypothetical protein
MNTYIALEVSIRIHDVTTRGIKMARKQRAWHFLAWISLLSELEGIVEIFARMVEDIASGQLR